MTALGDRILDFIREAKNEVLIVAPFIRTKALHKLVECTNGLETTVVTRWTPTDLLAGASDLGVYDLAQSHGIKLYLRSNLHAKFFAADRMCLVGSANVTESALGWRVPANLELLVAVSRDDADIIEFEKFLFAETVLATKEIQRQFEKLIENYEKSATHNFENNINIMEQKFLPQNWVPNTGSPSDLFEVYCGNTDISHFAAIKKELAQFEISNGLSEENFKNWIGAIISQTTYVQKALATIQERGQINKNDVERIFRESGINSTRYPANEALGILSRWLNYFLPGQYETTPVEITLRSYQKL